MTQPNDGGPAFPSDRFGELGMSLRDWFAGQALAGLCISRPERGHIWQRFSDDASELCYMIADAMLKARESDAP